jgi:UDP-2,3-diacylglucosamine pyrophosphatase LpxH
MLDHQQVLDGLKEAFPGEQGISLVAQHADPGLKLPKRRLHVFIPDCHMLAAQDQAAYPNTGFFQGAELLKLVNVLAKLKADNPGQLTVWCLGDLFDIWRARGGRGPAAEVDLIAAAYNQIVDLLRYGPPNGVAASIIAGNHDYGLYQMAEWHAARYRILQNEDPEGGDILVLHGDVFDWIEELPEEIKARAVRFATWHASGRKDLFNEEEMIAEVNRAIQPGDKPIGKAKVTLPARPSGNVINGEAGQEDAPNKHFYQGAKELAKALKKRGYNIRMIVIGHTHWARLLKGQLTKDEPFVLMDCGAWTGYCRLGTDQPWLHNGQIGVLAGDEARLYQVGRRKVATP